MRFLPAASRPPRESRTSPSSSKRATCFAPSAPFHSTEADAFSTRVFDVQEYLADHVGALPTVEPLDLSVAIQDPCHLRHVQRVHEATRVVLRPFVRDLIELDDDGLCCGAGGAYSVLEPELAGQIRDRKVDSIARARPDLVASANPGCSLHLAAADVPTIHPMQLVDRALHGPDDAP